MRNGRTTWLLALMVLGAIGLSASSRQSPAPDQQPTPSPPPEAGQQKGAGSQQQAASVVVVRYFTLRNSRSNPFCRAVNPVTTPSLSTWNVTIVVDSGLPSAYVVPDFR